MQGRTGANENGNDNGNEATMLSRLGNGAEQHLSHTSWSRAQQGPSVMCLRTWTARPPAAAQGCCGAPTSTSTSVSYCASYCAHRRYT